MYKKEMDKERKWRWRNDEGELGEGKERPERGNKEDKYN